MDFKKISHEAMEMDTKTLQRRFNDALRHKSKYKNLDADNRKVLFDLIKKYIDKHKKGQKVSSLDIRRDLHNLYQKRLKLDLTEEDFKDFKEILKNFTD